MNSGGIVFWKKERGILFRCSRACCFVIANCELKKDEFVGRSLSSRTLTHRGTGTPQRRVTQKPNSLLSRRALGCSLPPTFGAPFCTAYGLQVRMTRSAHRRALTVTVLIAGIWNCPMAVRAIELPGRRASYSALWRSVITCAELGHHL